METFSDRWVAPEAIPLRMVDRRPGDIAECYADPALAREVLGWTAELGIDAMCLDAWRWQAGNLGGD